MDRSKQEATATNICEQNGYLSCRVLEDGSIACLVDLMFTRAICLGVDECCPFVTRYCFSDRELATEQFDLLKSEDDVPVGFIAQRPERSSTW